MMSLPWDLFRFSININDDEMADNFIDVINNIYNKIGYYFNNHFMHERIWVLKIHIESTVFEKIYQVYNILNEILAIEISNDNDYILINKNSTLLDKICYKDKNDFIVDRKNFVVPKYLMNLANKEEFSTEINPLRRIFYLSLSRNSIDESLSILDDVAKQQIHIDILYIWWGQYEDGETLTNPIYFKNGVSKFVYCFKEIHKLSSNFYKNINSVQIQTLMFKLNHKVKGNFDIIQGLK